MNRLLERLASWRLQYILIVGFALTAAVTIIIGSLITSRVINNYLKDRQDAVVGRDMDLAEAFYNLKLQDISQTAGRLASTRIVRHNLPAAGAGDNMPCRPSMKRSKTKSTISPSALNAL